MDFNVIDEYVSYIKKSILEFYKIILIKKYDRKLIEPLLDKYLNVRYYNETDYPKETDLVERISKELKKVLKGIMNKDNEEIMKTIHALFGYILYFDDCYYIESDKDLLTTLYQDLNIRVSISLETQKKLEKFLRTFKKEKERYYDIFKSNQFSLMEYRIRKNIYKLVLTHDIKISNLYSESAVSKVFNMGTINEDKIFIVMAMASELILQNAINLDFSRKYVIDLVSSLFSKEKKMERLFRIINNTLAKKNITINILYSDYINNREFIDSLIKDGYSFGITIDENFDEEYDNFILFSYVFLYDTHENYAIIKGNKGKISSTLIVLQ